MNEKSSIKPIIVKALFIIGIIIIILVLAFAVIRFLPKLFSSVSSIGSLFSSSDKIEVTSNDTEINSGDKFSLSWDYFPKETGSYYFKYNCIDNLSLTIQTNGGTKNLLCNTSYNLNQSNNATFVATLNQKNSFVDLPVTVMYGIDSASQIESTGKATISVKNEGVAGSNTLSSASITTGEVIDVSNTTSGSETSSNSSGSTTSNNSNTDSVPLTSIFNQTGRADLAVSNIYSRDNQVSFTVSNIGSSASGVWTFSYYIPGEGTESSPYQMSLGRGQGIRYTLTFDNNDDGYVVVTIDPSSSVKESNENNNSFEANFEGDNSNSSNNNNYDDANLEITVMEVGRLNGNRFYEEDSIDENDEAAVRFVVKNTGDENTGSWRFEITNLPYDDSDDDEYRSSNQSSLRPGQSKEIILGFDNPDQGDYTIKVEVDSDDDVDEENERDNTETQRLEVED